MFPLTDIAVMPGVPPRDRIAISIDLEDYFQVEAMAGVIARAAWASLPARIEANAAILLDLFAAASVRATFFVVGWLARRFPRLIARIAAAGHELGCHSFWHRPVFGLARDEFRDDTRRAKEAIEAAAGVRVHGYRAPNFSIRAGMEWAWAILADAGFSYDSSVHPVHHPFYGAAGAPRWPHRVAAGRLWEFPLSSVAIAHHRLPMAGGGYWRLAPLAYTRWALRRALREGLRPICYLHPWELDPGQPRMPLRPDRRFRHYVGLATAETKLRALVAEFGCQPIARLFAPELDAAQREAA